MKKLYGIGLLALVLGIFSCTKNLTDLNEDPKNPQNVDAGNLFANAELALLDYMAGCNVNINNYRLYAQQWAQTTYADESNYELTERNVNGQAWNTLYATVIRDLKGVAVINAGDNILTDENKRNQAAMAEVLEIFTWHLLVDIFGDIPYTEAFTDDVTPKYDDDAAIYASLTGRLDDAIGKLSGESRMDGYDLIYGGDTGKWRKFANSLKLRLALRLADSDNAKAQRMMEEAVADGVFESNDDNFTIHYTSATPHTNPLWEELVQSGRSDFIAASTIVDPMKALDDPRLSYYFKDPIAGEILGGVYGDNNNFNAFSHPGDQQHDPTFPASLLTYSEVRFTLADGAERGYSVGGSAADHYHAGIAACILEWGGSQGEADTYIANPDVNYATAPGTWREKIALQKWIALYDKGFEAWSTWRIYDSPALPDAVQAMRGPLLRMTYPVTEFSLNGENVEAASDAIGGNTLDSKIFWDVN
ncbi:MAG: SusD/RagB family nutrient-binding outer membrane lipoprotein [Saprospiraceae bacterium]